MICAAVNGGIATTISTASINMIQTNNGIFIKAMPLHRMVMMVVIRFTPVVIEPKPLIPMPRIQ